LSQTARRIYRNDGLKGARTVLLLTKYNFITGFYKGYMPTLLRDAPSAGIFYMTYQWTKNLFPKQVVRVNLCA
jgi:hypothetical protein